MKRAALGICIILILVDAVYFLHTSKQEQSVDVGHLNVQGLQRDYIVYGQENTKNVYPLVLVLHGGGGPLGSAELMAEHSGWKEKAEQEHFIVVFLQGVLQDPSKPLNLTLGDPQRNIRLWHVGKNIPPVTHDGVDDVAYARAVLASVESKYTIDPTRVFITGFSNGATMTYRLASELSERVAAIAPVAGLLYPGDVPTSPISLLHIIGANDAQPTTTPPQGLLPVQDAAAAWAQFMHCAESGQISEEQDVHIQTFTSCERGVGVKGMYIQGLAHAYPGHAFLFGISSPDTFNATDLAWDFFKQHPKVRN